MHPTYLSFVLALSLPEAVSVLLCSNRDIKYNAVWIKRVFAIYI
jgi:hypothetical protein